jgi:hypothetical protein
MLGLGIGSGDKAAPYKTPHFIDYLKMNNKIDKRQFSLAFNRDAHPRNKNNG